MTAMTEPTAAPLIKSRQRVIDHAEVFTPPHIVEAMIKLVEPEVDRIDSRVLEPACGDGNFLVPILKRKLETAKARYAKSEFELRHHSLLALMSVYGVELLEDNAADCRQNLLDVFAGLLGLGIDADDESAIWLDAARAVLDANIVRGDALTYKGVPSGQPIVFAEWAYLGRGDFQRRDFRYDRLTTAGSFKVSKEPGMDSLFADMGKHELFTPIKTQQRLTVADIVSNWKAEHEQGASG